MQEIIYLNAKFKIYTSNSYSLSIASCGVSEKRVG
jgi:hypothetical protein